MGQETGEKEGGEGLERREERGRGKQRVRQRGQKERQSLRDCQPWAGALSKRQRAAIRSSAFQGMTATNEEWRTQVYGSHSLTAHSVTDLNVSCYDQPWPL